MKKEFVTYEQELALKELGCYISFETIEYERRLYVDSGGNETNESYVKEIKKRKILYQQAFRFFREKYNLSGFTLPWGDGLFDYRIYSTKEGEHLFNSPEYSTTEESESACLDNLIEIVKDLAVAE